MYENVIAVWSKLNDGNICPLIIQDDLRTPDGYKTLAGTDRQNVYLSTEVTTWPDDEIAAVLAHELAHRALHWNRPGPSSMAEEVEADARACATIEAAGYDPAAMIRALEHTLKCPGVEGADAEINVRTSVLTAILAEVTP